MTRSRSLSKWKARHAILVWIGIVLNLIIVAAVMLCPQWVLALLHIPEVSSIWPRSAVMLLTIITIFYIPATLDIDRYRIFAWLSVFPSRSFGAIFFFLAVFVLDQPIGFIIWVFLDGIIGASTLWCLIRIVKLEQDIAEGAT